MEMQADMPCTSATITQEMGCLPAAEYLTRKEEEGEHQPRHSPAKLSGRRGYNAHVQRGAGSQHQRSGYRFRNSLMSCPNHLPTGWATCHRAGARSG